MHYLSYAQEEDTSSSRLVQWKNNIYKLAVNAVTRGKKDSMPADVLEHKSEDPFLPYDGKGIRRVTILRFGFEKTFEDTSKGINYFGTRILNHLHRNTREWVIRNNLFFKVKEPLDAYQMADNERYLRSLEFIQDARILVDCIEDEPDSVDVTIVTKDLFSLSGELGELTSSRFYGNVSNANVLGLAQKVKFSMLWDNQRDPGFGYQFEYTKNNVAGTFINGSAGYTNIKPDLGEGRRTEHGWFLKFERPLPSASSTFAGAISTTHYHSQNSFARPDSSFYRYRYDGYDGWIGYNIGAKKFLRHADMKNRYFISIRYFNYDFTETPFQYKNQFYYTFNDRQALLTQFTFFRQNFYKTNYLYDFGNTEDMPYGYNIAVVGGWYKQMDLSRPYIGVDANRYVVTSKGYIMQYYVRTGGFFNSGKLDDAALLFGSSMYSRLFVFNKLKMRQYFNLSYTRQINRQTLFPLNINNSFGLPNYSVDSLTGNQRISFQSETTFFLTPKLFGFKFAPFVFGDGVLLTPEHQKFSKSSLYYGIGGGVRTRNENLVFGTIELRCVYFPRREKDNKAFKFSLTTNLRFRYNTNYVKAPDIIQLNSDIDNKIN